MTPQSKRQQLTRNPLARQRTSKQRVIDTFRSRPLSMFCLGLIILILLVAALAPLIAPHSYSAFNRGMPLKPPSGDFWFGTDRQTRDIFSRIVFGSRVSLAVGVAAVLIIFLIGITLGAIAGYMSGLVDSTIMRFTDVILAIPQLFLLIAAAALFTPGILTTMIVIGFTSWMGTARLVRGEFLRLRAQEFVTAARASGATDARVIWHHILPNILPLILVQATLWMSFAILVESSLSFLGLGVQPPTPSWGGMLADGRQDIQRAWWTTLFPGAAIFMTVFAFTIVGDTLRDAFDPRRGAK